LILITILIIITSSKPKSEDIILSTQILDEPINEIEPELKRDIIKEKIEISATTEVEPQTLFTSEEASEKNETDNNMELLSSEGSVEAISEAPQVGSGLLGNIGGGGGGGGSFGTRTGGGKKRAILKGGGSKQTESTVDAALQWLKRHQEKDGHWDGLKYGDGVESGMRLGEDKGMTELARLVFLSGGHATGIRK